MKEQYLRPAVVNANSLELSMSEKDGDAPILESILAAVAKKILSNFGPTIVGNIAPSATMRRVYGAMDLGAKNSSLTERKF